MDARAAAHALLVINQRLALRHSDCSHRANSNAGLTAAAFVAFY